MRKKIKGTIKRFIPVILSLLFVIGFFADDSIVRATESAAHVHSEECYDENETLICGQEVPDEEETASAASITGDEILDSGNDENTEEGIAAFSLNEDTVASVNGEEYETLSAAYEAAGDGDTIVLLSDIADGYLYVTKEITIDFNGHTITAGYSEYPAFWVGNGSEAGNLTLAGTGTVYGRDDCSKGIIYINNTDSIVTLKDDVTLRDSSYTAATAYGGAVRIQNGTFNMEGGTITNTAVKYGGAVAVINGIFNMSGGTIDGTSAYYYGGAVYNYGSGTFNMSGGTIQNCSAAVSGGGIYSTGPVTVTGSVISGNTAKSSGGGIFTQGNLILTDSTIAENKGSSGGGIYVADNYSSFEKAVISGCNIIDNAAAADGGGIYSYGGAEEFTIDDCKVSGNEARTGGGLYLGGPAHITDTEISNNKSSSNAAGLYLQGQDSSCSNVTVSGNVCTSTNETVSAVYLVHADSDEEYSIKIEECTFEKNEASNTIYTIGRGKPVLFENCTIKDNESTNATVYLDGWPTAPILMKDCTITNNRAGVAGAIMDEAEGDTALINVRAEENEATGSADPKTGGIYIDKTGGTFTVTVCEVGNNTLSDATVNNWYISSKSNVSLETGRKIAQIDSSFYESIAEAVDAVKKGEKIVLIAGDEDEYGTGFSSSEVSINKKLTIKLNNRTIHSVDEGLFAVKRGGELTLEGAGVLNGAVSVENGGSLTLDCQVEKLTISIEEGGSIAAGASLDCKSIKLSIPEKFLDSFNTPQKEQEDFVLIETNDEDLIDKISIVGLTNPLVDIKYQDGKLVLCKEILSGIFIDGVNGNDTYSGSYESPVKTFAEARKLLMSSDSDTIYVLDQITVDGSETWALDGGKISRYPTYKGTLVHIGTDAGLTLENITIDGAREYGVNDAQSMIYIGGGKLTIEDGAVLQNNDVSNYGASMGKGGAIYHSRGTLTMNGGTIQNCSAVAGGGIYLINENYRNETATIFEFNNGKIENNSCYKNYDDPEKGPLYASGGGVLIDGTAVMKMHGGTISGNESEMYGGGVALGGHAPKVISAESVENFVMDGGKITGNKAGQDGGGIFIQSTFNAAITAGYITDNDGGFGHFGGGGIYVNGGKSEYENGRLQLYNVLIADNEAGTAGGGIAGCSTSDVEQLIIDGGAIYQNTADGKKDDILILNSDGTGVSFPVEPESYISEFMLGGGAYLWKRVDTGDYADLNYLHEDGVKRIYNEWKDADARIQTAKSEATVFIIGNTADKRGGGIGSNGDVYIGGKSDNTIDISVTKVWDDNNDDRRLRPDSVRIWLLRNGERVSCLDYMPDEDGSWPTLTFTDQLKSDEKGKAYTYTVEEDESSLKNRYTSVCKKTGENTWTVTNTLAEPDDSKTTDKPDKPGKSQRSDGSDGPKPVGESVVSPKTGDGSNIALWSVLAVFSLAGLVGMMTCFRKKTFKK